jgi:hypothetical protein
MKQDRPRKSTVLKSRPRARSLNLARQYGELCSLRKQIGMLTRKSPSAGK